MFGIGEAKQFHEKEMKLAELKKQTLFQALQNDSGKMVFLKENILKLAFIVGVHELPQSRTKITYLRFDTKSYDPFGMTEDIFIYMSFDEVKKAIQEAIK